MADELKVLTAAANEPEAEMIRVRLLDAGIPTILQRTLGGPEWGGSGARNIFVKEEDLERARAVLEADVGVDEDELARQSEEAGGR